MYNQQQLEYLQGTLLGFLFHLAIIAVLASWFA
jgi:hypothetical protein